MSEDLLVLTGIIVIHVFWRRKENAVTGCNRMVTILSIVATQNIDQVHVLYLEIHTTASSKLKHWLVKLQYQVKHLM